MNISTDIYLNTHRTRRSSDLVLQLAEQIEEEADDRSNGRKMVCLPNSKSIMMKLMQSRIKLL